MTLPAQDIVERLREPEFVTTDTGRFAADLIESQGATISRLTADNKALRAALRGMIVVGEAYLPYDAPNGPCETRLNVVRAALGGSNHG